MLPVSSKMAEAFWLSSVLSKSDTLLTDFPGHSHNLPAEARIHQV